MTVPISPFAGGSLATWAERFRAGTVCAADAVETLLARIAALEPKLNAFTVVDDERARARAAAIDRLRQSGADLGPLMGVPIAVKDLVSVTGLQTTAGSRVDITDLVPPQGSMVNRLECGGAILLGKTRTTEFALGGCNLRDSAPWNPCDSAVARMTGGSSHGSAVAMAASLAGFTLGSDTGGSVRWPAALCGVVGYKTTTEHWPLDGVFPLSRSMDSLGTFTSTIADAAWIEGAVTGTPPPVPTITTSLVLALPGEHFFENIGTEVQACFDEALRLLRRAGVAVVERPLPEAGEIDAVFGQLVTAEWLAFVGRERFLANESLIDPVAAARIRQGLDLPADLYVRLDRRREALVRIIAARAEGIDGWISPTVPTLPQPCSEFADVTSIAAWNRLNTQNTRPGNLFGQCGVSLPMHHLGASLPVGLQIMAPPGNDRALLSAALAIEAVIGSPPRTDAMLNFV